MTTILTASTEAQLSADLTEVNAAVSGSFVIDLQGDITETADLTAIDLRSGVTLVIDGSNGGGGSFTLDGGGSHDGIIVDSVGTGAVVTLENLDLGDVPSTQPATLSGGTLSATVTILGSATFDQTADLTLGDSTAPATVANQGVYEIDQLTAGGYGPAINGVAGSLFDNSGTLVRLANANDNSGISEFYVDVTDTGTISVPSGSNLRFDGASNTFAGTYIGGGMFDYGDPATFQTLGYGSYSVSTLGNLDMSQSACTTTWGEVNQNGQVTTSTSTSITNFGTWNFTSDNGLTLEDPNSASASNSEFALYGGVLAKTGGTGTTVIGIDFNEYGGPDSNQGGSIEIASGTLAFDGLVGNFYSTVSGNGTFALGGGGADSLYNGTTISTSGWTLAGTGTDVTVDVALSYSGIFAAGLGTTLTLAASTDLTLSNATFDGRVTGGSNAAIVLTNGGTLQINDLASVVGGSQIQNFNVAIGGFASGDTLRLEGFGTFTTINGLTPTYNASINETSLTLTDNGTTVATLNLTGGNYTDATVTADPLVSGAVDIVLGGPGNTLIAQGAGVFDLRSGSVSSSLQVVDLTGATAGQTQVLYLRNGLDLTVNVLDAAAVYIYGAANNDIINLGSGAASVTLGGPDETVNGGTGTETFTVTRATAGAAINAGTGANVLNVQNGGTVVMGSGSGIQNVFLNTATAAYDFVANASANQVIHASLNGNDTVVVGAASQEVYGYNGALTVQATAANAGAFVRTGAGGATLDITTGGSVTLNAADSNLAVRLAVSDTLTVSANTSIQIAGGAGSDTLIVTNGVLRARQTIAAGGTGNTLLARGAGLFDLSAPAVLSGIQVLDLTGAIAGQTQVLYLRNGLDLTVNVQDAATIDIHGAANNDIINLGSGAANVTLGGPGETVNGGLGNETFYVTAATAGASINAGSGANVLQVQNGGTVVLGAGGGIQNVFLNTATVAYDFVANATARQVIHATLNGADTIVAGAASQSVYGYNGALTVQATAANAGAFIRTGAGGATLDITTGGSVALNTADSNLTVQLSAATNLTLGPLAFIKAIGAATGHDIITAGGGNQTLASIGGNDTLVGSSNFHDIFLGASTGMNGDTIQGFGGLGNLADKIDLTDIATTGSLAYSGSATQGELSVTDGVHSAHITMIGNYNTASFSPLTTDGHGGSFITFV